MEAKRQNRQLTPASIGLIKAKLWQDKRNKALCHNRAIILP